MRAGLYSVAQDEHPRKRMLIARKSLKGPLRGPLAAASNSALAHETLARSTHERHGLGEEHAHGVAQRNSLLVDCCRSAAPASELRTSARPRCSASASRTAPAVPPAPTRPAERQTPESPAGDPRDHRRTGTPQSRRLPCSKATGGRSGRSAPPRRRAPRSGRPHPSSPRRTASRGRRSRG